MPMAKVQIVGPRADRASVFAILHRLGVLELAVLTPSSPAEMITMRTAGRDQQRIRRVEAAISRLDALLARTPVPASDSGHAEAAPSHPEADSFGPTHGPMRLPASLSSDASSAGEPAAVEEWLEAVEPQVGALVARQSALDAEVANLREYRDVMERILPLAGNLPSLEGFETIALIIEPTFGSMLSTLRDELAAITPQSELVAAESADGSIAALVVVSRRFAPDVHRLLESERLSDVRLPAAYHGRPLQEAVQELARRQDEIPNELAAATAGLVEVLAPQQARILVWRTLLLDEMDELVAVGQCLESEHTFALVGWVPSRDLLELETALTKSFGGRVVVEKLPVGRREYSDVPVLLDNPPLFRPFEILLRLLPLPRYGTLDPTMLVSFFFPLFFGFALGDIGYGLILLAAAGWIGWRWRGVGWVRQVSHVARLSAIAAIAFGVAFGELFGNLGQMMGLRPLVVDRTEAIEPLLLFSVGLGAVQVGLGLVLGAVNAFLEGHQKDVLAKGATLIGLVAIFALVGVVADLLPEGFFTPSLALLAVATAVLVYSAGIGGPLDLLGVIGNVLSYTRLAAVGLASVVLARVANEFAGLAGSILLGVVVGSLFHALNLTLGLFSPSIQSLRLQYVEFFGRFLLSGGRPYRPFRRRLASIPGGQAAA